MTVFSRLPLIIAFHAFTPKSLLIY